MYIQIDDQLYEKFAEEMLKYDIPSQELLSFAVKCLMMLWVDPSGLARLCEVAPALVEQFLNEVAKESLEESNESNN